MFQKHWEEVHCGTFPGDLRYKNAAEILLLQIRGGGGGGWALIAYHILMISNMLIMQQHFMSLSHGYGNGLNYFNSSYKNINVKQLSKCTQ